MKKILSFLLLSVFVEVGLLQAQSVTVLPSNDNIQYTGRMTMRNANAPVFSMPSTSIKAKFNGTAISATFSNTVGNSYLYVIIDGNADPYNRNVIRITQSNQTFVLADGLTAGEHTVEIVKVNEYDTKVTFNGFTIEGGSGLVAPPARPSLQIEYFGDSNAAGWSAWDVRDEGFARLSGGYYTYPAMVGRMLNAEISNFSAGGYGVTDNMNRLDLKDYYHRIHITGGNGRNNQWDFENNYFNFDPDVVVINLGANDYYAGANKNTIKSSWQQFVNTLRGHYPTAHIVMANSYGWAIGEPADYVGEFVTERQAAGDQNISFVKFPWLWSDYHAVINEHATFANILSTHIAEVLNLPTPTPSDLSTFAPYGQVGNGSFESSLMEGFADGWRPFATWSFPEYVANASDAYDGNSYIRCPATYGVMHAAPASEGDIFDLSVYAKTVTGNRGRLKYEFRDQGQNIITEGQQNVRGLNSTWQQVELTTNAAPAGTWQINVILEARNNSTVDFDLAEMSLASSNARKRNDVVQLENELKIVAYPNPTTDFILLKGSTNETHFNVYNIQGISKLEGIGNRVDLSNLSNGIYFIQVEGNQTPFKIIKQ